jgi:hypothetical protein
VRSCRQHLRAQVGVGRVAPARQQPQHARLAEALLGQMVDDEAVTAEQLDAEIGDRDRGLDRADPGLCRPEAGVRLPRSQDSARREQPRAVQVRSRASSGASGGARRLAEDDRSVV